MQKCQTRSYKSNKNTHSPQKFFMTQNILNANPHSPSTINKKTKTNVNHTLLFQIFIKPMFLSKIYVFALSLIYT